MRQGRSTQNGIEPDGKDAITGQDLGDHLYGGNEDDVLSGGKGDDYLQGDAGADRLEGGEGSDTLIGGNGSDEYVFSGGFGDDVIVDSDGQIMVDGQKVAGESARKIAENIYKDPATGWTFKTTDLQLSGHATLFITQGGHSGRSITVRNWQNGNLGIPLNDMQQEGPTGMLMFKGAPLQLIYGSEVLDADKTSNSYIPQQWNTWHRAGKGDDLDFLWSDRRIHSMIQRHSNWRHASQITGSNR
ncbi:MAG: calcium-binding protein [Aquabacterium sp.]